LVDVTDRHGVASKRPKGVVLTLHCDIIKERFWTEHPEILSGTPITAQRWQERQEQAPGTNTA
ncbi:hypothetical protein EV180_006917, partial [Coemansia sp. RSA 518]